MWKNLIDKITVSIKAKKMKYISFDAKMLSLEALFKA